MRLALVTFMPLTVAAIIVVIGGERLVRQEEQNRTPIDPERFLHFSELFRAELLRLDQLYQGHLKAGSSAT